MSLKRVVLTTLLTSAFAGAVSAQTAFAPSYFPLNQPPQNQLQVDLNGDGIPDILTFYSGSGDEELLSSGNGSFALHTISFNSGGYIPLASGDFNGDGKADVLFYDFAGGSRLFVIAYGDGKGDFTTLAAAPNLPGITTGVQDYIVAQTADFNGDGRPDVALAYRYNNSVAVHLFLNNGNGFTDSGTVYSFPLPAGAALGVLYDPAPGMDLLLGDYDSDGHADLALRILYSTSSNPVSRNSNLVSLYGNGAGHFTPATVYANRDSDLVLSSADINNDGRSDLAGGDSDYTLHIFYGHTNRIFTETVLPGTSNQGTMVNYNPVQIADLDGNGLKDIAFAGDGNVTSSLGYSYGMNAYYQTAPGVFTLGAYTRADDFSIHSIGEYPLSGTLLGDYNHDGIPDFALFETDTGISHPNAATLMMNTGARSLGSCPAPRLGINACNIVSSQPNPVRIPFSATMFYPIRKMEVWVDGAKRSETYQVFANQGYSDGSLTLPAGRHKIELYSVAFDQTIFSHLTYYTTAQ